MRTLLKNKTKLYYVNPTGFVNYVDGDNNYTGEVTETYSTPSEVYVHLYPSGGLITEQMFGKDANIDMIAVSCENDIEFTKDTLLFVTSPVSNYPTTYDYKVSEIKQSLNNIVYGLNRRT